ncbi:hypothetical protein GO986_08785 [Deinococcus sp. HMF7620]|uniref:Uncharacterized protein n=1 Tax=Deinococcus arboris TaxID=2682977 RepID=A0A7C9LKQ0_9DEIO|nr:hypothetical protein [Deinococcus arboris]MVN86858.1 hypothetical protein [Deinococcus arboris]
MTAATKTRTVHFFEFSAVLRDPTDPSKTTDADLEPLWRNMNRLAPIKGVPNSSFHAFWGSEMVVAIDHNRPNVVLGRSVKLRRDALPGLLSAGKFRRIMIKADEFLHETSHFAFFKDSRVIAIEYNTHAPNYRYLEKYLNDMANALSMHIDDISLTIKLDKNTVAKLLASGPVTAVEVTAHADDVATLPAGNRLVRALRGVVGDQPTRYKATVNWSRERPAKNRPRGLDDEFKADALALLEASGAIVDALKVTVEPPGGGTPRTIDLKRDRHFAAIDVLLTSERSIDTDDTYAKIIKYYNEYVIGEAKGK